jgi:hypothetical protein
LPGIDQNLEKLILIERRNNQNGAAHQEKSERIVRSLLAQTNKHYFRKGDAESLKRIFILLITWLCYWKGSQQEMLFFCDKSDCEMGFLMVGGSSSEWVFPELSNVKQPSNTISKLFFSK